MKTRISLILLLLFLAGCVTGYRGDGSFSELTRTYVPVIGVTRGYMIEMPAFTPEKDQSLTYSLAGMPRQNQAFTVEMAIYIPKDRLSPQEQQALDVSVPEGHAVHVSLIDTKSHRVVAETTSKVNALYITDTIGFRQSPCIRRLLRVNFKDVPKDAGLEIRIEYRTDGVPLRREMLVLVVNDAPLA